LDKRRNPLLREPLNLLTHSPDVIQCKKGIPIFRKGFPDFKQTSLTSMTKYKEPAKATPRPPIIKDAANLHEMKSKFRFSAEGFFQNKGTGFETDILRLCRTLELVGWVKCRRRFALGHLQGDVTSLAYLKRWLDRDETKGGKIQNVRFYDENFGIANFDFTNLIAIYDRRTMSKKKLHLLMLRNRISSLRFHEASDRRNQEIERFLETHCVRNY